MSNFKEFAECHNGLRLAFSLWYFSGPKKLRVDSKLTAEHFLSLKPYHTIDLLWGSGDLVSSWLPIKVNVRTNIAQKMAAPDSVPPYEIEAIWTLSAPLEHTKRYLTAKRVWVKGIDWAWQQDIAKSIGQWTWALSRLRWQKAGIWAYASDIGLCAWSRVWADIGHGHGGRANCRRWFFPRAPTGRCCVVPSCQWAEPSHLLHPAPLTSFYLQSLPQYVNRPTLWKFESDSTVQCTTCSCKWSFLSNPLLQLSQSGEINSRSNEVNFLLTHLACMV